jgi:pyruvate carboxylase
MQISPGPAGKQASSFVGPRVELLENLGDKTAARDLAQRAGVPILAGSPKAVESLDDALAIADGLGYPVMLKAAHGGGGRGMRVVRTKEELPGALESAQRESKTAFGSTSVFIEKFIERARHIEVQLLGDTHGNLVHLFERDCSVQRRHQKVVELAPAPNLAPRLRDQICDAAIAIGQTARYENAGTVEFLVDADADRFYFIEVNPRIQVEHTVTEEITGIDMCGVSSRLRLAINCLTQRLAWLTSQLSGPWGRQSSAGLRPKIRRIASCLTMAALRPTAPPAAWAFGWMLAPPFQGPSSHPTSTRCWSN